MAEYGDNLSTGVTTKIVYETTGTGRRKTVTIQCDWDSRDSNIPDLGTTSESLPLTTAGAELLPGNIAQITLIYESQIYEYETIPSTTYEETSSVTELDIRQHPDFSEWSDDWDDEKGEFKPGTSFYGISSYLVGTTTVTKTEYFSSEPSSDYTSNGTLEVPGGGFGGSNQWLIVGTSRSKLAEGLFSKQTQYLYSAKAYPTAIYS